MNSSYTNLDILRSIAVLSVLVQHLWHQCVNSHLCTYDQTVNDILSNLSFTGVMFFFVHTCLVLMLSLQRTPELNRGVAFFIRRVFRIYPLAWVTVLIALTSSLTDHPEANLHALGWKGVAANLMLVENVARNIPSVVGPLWSLPWETQMYLALPLFFILLRKWNRLFAVFMLWTVSTAAAIAATQPGVPRFFHAAVFPPMFIGGMVAYKLLVCNAGKMGRFRLPGWAWPLFICGLFLADNWLMIGRSFESPAGTAINSSVCLVLGLGVFAFGQTKSVLLTVPAQEVAKYSYGVYLLHVPVLIAEMRYLPQMSIVISTLVFLLLTAFASVVSFHWIEDPLIRIGKRLAAKVQMSSFRGRTVSGSPNPNPSYFAPPDPVQG